MLRYCLLAFCSLFASQLFAEDAMLTSQFNNGFTPLYGSTSTVCKIFRDRVEIERKVADITTKETIAISLDIDSLRAIQEKVIEAKNGKIETPNPALTDVPTITYKAGETLLKQSQGEKDVQVNDTQGAASLAILLEVHCP